MDIDHRIRQHNREIKGGAYRTLYGSPNWVVWKLVNGFKDKIAAQQFESNLKYQMKMHNRIGKNNEQRDKAMAEALSHPKWSKTLYLTIL